MVLEKRKPCVPAISEMHYPVATTLFMVVMEVLLGERDATEFSLILRYINLKPIHQNDKLRAFHAAIGDELRELLLYRHDMGTLPLSSGLFAINCLAHFGLGLTAFSGRLIDIINLRFSKNHRFDKSMASFQTLGIKSAFLS